MLDTRCEGLVAAYVLANTVVRPPLDPNDKAISHTVLLPPSWRQRITQAAKDHQERQAAFFKREGEKAIKALGGKAQP